MYLLKLYYFQDLKQHAYKHNGCVLLTYAGAEKFVQLSKNTNAIKYKEEILAYLHSDFVNLHATTKVGNHDKMPRHAKDTVTGEKRMPQSTALITTVWPNRRTYTPDDFEKAVTCFFLAPEIAEWKARIDALEDKWEHESLLILEESMAEMKVIYGYVYALWNPLFPDLVKIGATFRTPQIRAHELSGTGMPEPFEVVTKLKCRNPFKMERGLHKHYLSVRKYGKRKEFFMITTLEAIKQFDLLKKEAMVIPTTEEQTKINRRTSGMKRFRE